MRLLLAASFLAHVILTVQADVILSIPLENQLPQIAHIGSAYNWTLEQNSFTDDSSNSSLTYNTSDLPDWVQFDATSLTFSGSPNSSDEGGIQVYLTAISTGDNSSASDSFTLLTLKEASPILSIPIAQQLLDPNANSLGPKNVLADNILHIPLGWSFSMGFNGDTFVMANGNVVFMSASINGTTELPSWLTWSADTYTLYGVAPSDVGTGELLYNVVMTGSNKPGFGGATDSFQIKVSAHTLNLSGQLRSVNTSVDDVFRYTVPTTGLTLDGRQNDNTSNPVNVTVNLANLPWISFDSTSATLSGSPPFEQYKDANTTQMALVPVTFSDTYGNHLAANLTINITPYAFTAQNLPNIIVNAGEKVNVSLAQYIRTDSTPVSLIALEDTMGNSTDGQAVSATFDPANATSWLTFDSEQLLLTGTMPSNANTKVKVNMSSSNANNQTSSASFYVASSESSLGTSVGNGANDGKGGKSGLSHRAKLALAASLGGVGGLLCLILLMICCRRHVAKEEHDHNGYIHDNDDDEATLTDTSSQRKFKKAIVIRRAQEALTPNSQGASPYFDQEKQATTSKVVAFQGVVVEDPNGEKRDITHEADEPMQSKLMNNIFGGKRRGANKNTATTTTTTNAGLGLGLEDAAIDSHHQGVPNSRSQHSTRTHRSSWESDLFYEDAVANRKSLTAPDPADDVPRRRGVGGGLNVRHRNTHINESPAFHAPGTFTPPEGMSESESHPNMMSTADYDDEEGYHSQNFGASRAGLSPLNGLEEAEILEAKVMQVRKHSPMMQTNDNPFSKIRGRTAEAEEKTFSGAFDDAEGEEEVDMFGRDLPIKRGDPKNRISTLSAMTDNSQMQAVRHHYANEEAAATHGPIKQQDVFSPNPSFMDGASLSGYEPQETMRAIVPRPRTPPPPFTHKQNSKSSSSANSRFIPCPCVAAIVNYPVRFHIFPNVPPPMAGAPGSPGKRSGEAMRYSLIVDDSRPHLSPFRMTWPDMLGDWLTFNDATFEAFGIVPDNAGLEDLGDVEIALISTKRTARVPPSPGSPSKKNKRNSTRSVDSSHTAIYEEDVTVVARAKLVFQPGPQAF